MPMFRSCMSPTTTPLNPASASAPLAIINNRIVDANRLPLKIGAANSIESGKNTSQLKMSTAYATEGHLNDKQRRLRQAGKRLPLMVKMTKWLQDVTPASRPMNTKEARLSALAPIEPK